MLIPVVVPSGSLMNDAIESPRVQSGCSFSGILSRLPLLDAAFRAASHILTITRTLMRLETEHVHKIQGEYSS